MDCYIENEHKAKVKALREKAEKMLLEINVKALNKQDLILLNLYFALDDVSTILWHNQ